MCCRRGDLAIGEKTVFFSEEKYNDRNVKVSNSPIGSTRYLFRLSESNLYRLSIYSEPGWWSRAEESAAVE
jgi:hypothetical protein